MGAMFFGQYLLSKGAISREALIDAIELQRRSNLSVTELAVRKGYLTPRQHASIQTRYRTSDIDLETLCLESGLIDSAQLDELVEIQRSDWVRIGAALVAGGHLTRDEVEERLVEFREVQRETDKKLAADFESCPNPELVRSVVELTVFHLGRLTNLPIKLGSFSEGAGRLRPGRRRYGMKLVGDREICIVLDLPPEVARLVAEGLIGLPLDAETEVAIDAVCECVNIIGGNACTRLEALGIRLRPEPPFSTAGDEPATEKSSAFCANVIAGEQGFDVQVFLW
jgi:hypothetical protein